MTPPQVRLPISLPSPSVLKRYGKISPSEAENSLVNVTIGPVNVCGGSVCGMPFRAIPTITSARRNRSITNGETNPPPLPNIYNERMFTDLRKVKFGELVQPGLAHIGDVQVTDFAAGFLVYVIDIFLHPIEVVKRRFIVGGHKDHVPRAGVSPFGVHAQDHLFVGGADERVVKIRQRGDRSVVDS